MIKKLGFIALIPLIIFSNISVIAHADENNKPILSTYQDGNNAKVEWAIEILDEDLLYRTGFETIDELPSLNYGAPVGNRYFGGQEFSELERYSGLKSLRVNDSYTNGNYGTANMHGVVTYADYSVSQFLNRKYMENGTDLSMSFRAKTTGTGYINPIGIGGAADFGSPIDGIYFTQDVKVGDRTVKINNPGFFKGYVDNGQFYYIAANKGLYTSRTVDSVDMANSTITLNAAFTGEFKAGENVLAHKHLNPVGFGTRTVNNKDDWQLYNLNTKVLNYHDYNTLTRGFILWITTYTHDIIYIDDLKMGYATQVELYRDGGLVYQGKLADYSDMAATDKVKPNKVIDYNVSNNSGKQYVNVIEPEDNGSQYNYQLRAISNDGSGAYWSDIKNVNIKSGLKGYSYVIDKNNNTNPNGIINNSNGVIAIEGDVYKDHYLHIQAIDNAGNKSEVNHIKLDKVKDLTPPVVNITQDPFGWINSNVTINIDTSDPQSGINNVVYINGNKQIENNKLVVTENGSYEFAVTNNAGLITTQEYLVSNIDKVNPTANITPSTLGITHEDILLEIKANDNLSGVKRIQLPDGTWFNGANAEYNAKSNGVYKFIVEDNAGNVLTKTLEIKNIDKTLNFVKPIIEGELDIAIQRNMTAEIDINNLSIADWRDEGNNWRLLLEATQLENGIHVLPIGTISLKGVKDIVKIDGNKNGAITMQTENVEIDNGPIELVKSINERGIYKINFKDEVLVFNFPVNQVRKGTYKTKLTWTLESTSEIN